MLFWTGLINICAYEVGRYFGKSGLKVENLFVEGAIKLVKAGATKEIESARLDKIMWERLYKRESAPTINIKEVIKRLNQKGYMLQEWKKIKKWTDINKYISG